jgi:hypothetical protein
MRIHSLPCLLLIGALASPAACAPREQVSASEQTKPFEIGSIDQILAPIALYPDSLLAQILMSAAEPAKIAELDKWLKANQSLKGTALQDAAVKAGFDASFVALTLFPQVVATMAQQIGWTSALGKAFTDDRTKVFDSIQKLRKQAQTVGTLKDTPQQDVETKKTEAGQDVIVIEPTNPQIIYVPQYNTQVVYTQPPTTTTVVIQEEDDDDAAEAMAAGMIGFTAGIVIGATMDNHYYYGPYGWHGGGYMYADAWDDYYDHREDAREDWMDHREDLSEERTDRVENRSETRSDRVENRPETAQRTQTQRSTQAQSASAGTTAETQRADRAGSTTSRGHGDGSRTQSTTQRSGGGSDAFSGYSSGASQRSASSRGQTSRSSSRGGGGRRR